MATLLVQLPYTVRYGQPQSPSRASRLSAYVVLCTLTVRYGLTTYELLLVVGISGLVQAWVIQYRSQCEYQNAFQQQSQLAGIRQRSN